MLKFGVFLGFVLNSAYAADLTIGAIFHKGFPEDVNCETGAYQELAARLAVSEKPVCLARTLFSNFRLLFALIAVILLYIS